MEYNIIGCNCDIICHNYIDHLTLLQLRANNYCLVREDSKIKDQFKSWERSIAFGFDINITHSVESLLLRRE